MAFPIVCTERGGVVTDSKVRAELESDDPHRAVCDSTASGWFCTRDAGHDGFHIAGARRGLIAAAWL